MHPSNSLDHSWSATYNDTAMDNKSEITDRDEER